MRYEFFRDFYNGVAPALQEQAPYLLGCLAGVFAGRLPMRDRIMVSGLLMFGAYAIPEEIVSRRSTDNFTTGVFSGCMFEITHEARVRRNPSYCIEPDFEEDQDDIDIEDDTRASYYEI